MLIDLNTLRDAALAALRRRGLDRAAADVIVDHLADAESLGHASHGFYRLPSILRRLDVDGPGISPSVKVLGPSQRLVNGNGSPGLIAVDYAAAITLRIARETGLCVTGVHGYRGTTGALGRYVRSLAQGGVAGLAMCNSEASVAPTGGREPILGTNPIAISFPSDGGPVVADIATAARSYGSLVESMDRGESVPVGVVLDPEGNPSTDPHDADHGAMLPMSGHKGYALGMLIELLAGPFVGAKAGREAVAGTNGALLIGLKADMFRDSEATVLSETQRLIEEIRGSALAPGSSSIRVPGYAIKRLARVDVRDSILEALAAADQSFASLSSEP